MISNPTPKYLYTNQCHSRPSPFICKKRRYNIDTENGGRNIFVGLAAPSSLLIRLSTLMLQILFVYLLFWLFVVCCLLVFSQMPIMVWLFGLVCLRRTLLLLSSLFVIGQVFILLTGGDILYIIISTCTPVFRLLQFFFLDKFFQCLCKLIISLRVGLFHCIL